MPQDISKIYAFIDESGNSDLNTAKPGASNLFICTAVIIKENNLSGIEECIRKLQASGGQELKSSKIGGDHGRRIKILQAITKLPLGYYALIIDKARIDKESGLKYKPSFYKFISSMLLRSLANGGNLHTFADNTGSIEFMESFKDYYERKLIADLFRSWEHKFVDSKKCLPIQIADIISGSLSYCYDQEKRCEKRNEFLKLLQPLQIGVRCWPFRTLEISNNLPLNEDDLNVYIESCNINNASNFLKNNENDDADDVQMQVLTLEFLLSFKENGIRTSYADTLIDHLVDMNFPALTRQQFSLKVIGPLRDNGIIIAGSNDGYCLASTVTDIDSYINHDKSVIEPMLARLQRARQSIKLETGGTFDIMKKYDLLRMLLDKFEEGNARHHYSRKKA